MCGKVLYPKTLTQANSHTGLWKLKKNTLQNLGLKTLLQDFHKTV